MTDRRFSARDPHGNIYSTESTTDVPSEDEARLDGYLRAKAEVGEKDRLRLQLALERQTHLEQELMDRKAAQAALEAVEASRTGGDG